MSKNNKNITNILKNYQVKNINIKDLIPYARNAKKHDKVQIANVAESIRQFGFVQPIVVDKDKVVIIGHCRLLAAQKLGMEEVPVIIADNLTPTDVTKLRNLDNKLNESEWDFDLLSVDIADFDFDGFDIDWGLPEEDEGYTDVEEDEAPEVDEVEHRCQLGDIWQLGDHRLMCGDSTNVENISKLMGGGMADLYLTDPPYNVALGQNGGHKLRPSEAKQLHRRTDGLVIENDSWKNEDEFINFLVSCFSSAMTATKSGAPFYIWYADTQALNFRLAAKNANLEVRQNLIWNKHTFALGRQDYQWKHEPCLYGWKAGAAHNWYSDRKQTTVLNFDKPSNSEMHPTMKPVALFSYLIENSTKSGDIVLDTFGGSGTSIIACEQLGRRCYTMELDPKYCDVILQRYINFKGSDADVFLLKDEKKIPYSDVKS